MKYTQSKREKLRLDRIRDKADGKSGASPRARIIRLKKRMKQYKVVSDTLVPKPEKKLIIDSKKLVWYSVETINGTIKYGIISENLVIRKRRKKNVTFGEHPDDKDVHIVSNKTGNTMVFKITHVWENKKRIIQHHMMMKYRNRRIIIKIYNTYNEIETDNNIYIIMVRPC